MSKTDKCNLNAEKSLVGHKIENFTFDAYNPANDSFEQHNFSEFFLQGNWLVLYFYPADFTFVCPTELSDVANYQDELNNLNVKLISMSTDTHYTHLAWCKAEKLLTKVKFLMGSDPNGHITDFFGIYDSKAGTALRGTFIINPEGILVGSEVNYYNVGRNAKELLRKLNAYTYLYDNPHLACPAAWEAGQEALAPSEKMVGQVFKFYEKPE